MATALPATGFARGRIAGLDRRLPAGAIRSLARGRATAAATRVSTDMAGHAIGAFVQAAALVLQSDRHSVQSAYFEVNGRLRFNDIGLRETALIRRQGLQTHTVWQERRPWWSRRSCMSAESSPC